MPSFVNKEGYITRWIGWNTTDGSDKIWGIIPIQDIKRYTSDNYKCLIFWGRRGSTKYQTKIIDTDYYSADRMVKSKMDKGYNWYETDRDLEAICNGLPDQIGKMVLWAKMVN